MALNKKGAAIGTIAVLVVFSVLAMFLFSNDSSLTGAGVANHACKDQCESNFKACEAQHKDCNEGCKDVVSGAGSGKCNAVPCNDRVSAPCPVNFQDPQGCMSIGCYWCGNVADDSAKKACKDQCESDWKACETQHKDCKEVCKS